MRRTYLSGLTMEFVKVSQVIQQLFQVLADLRYLQIPVYHDVQHRNKSETHIAEVDGNRTAVSAIRLFGRKFLRVLSVES